MIRMTRLTDYGIMLLTHFARDRERLTRSARELAAETRLPLPTVSKVLKRLAHGRVLEAHRGVKGGFSLARRPEEVNLTEIITALEGPVAITQCSTHEEKCGLERQCIVRSNWRRINLVVLDALKRITLADMTHPLALLPAPVHRVNLQARTL